MSKPNYNSNQTDLDSIDEQENLELQDSDQMDQFVDLNSVLD